MSREKEFKPRHSMRHAWIFILGFSLFLIMGAAAIIFGQLMAGIAILAFGIAAQVFFLSKVLSIGIFYTAGERGLRLKNLYSKLDLPYSDIDSASLMSEDETTSFLLQYYRSVMVAEKTYNLSKWFKSAVKYGNPQKFVSIPVTSTVVKSGGHTSIVDYKVNFAGDAVLIRDTSNNYYLVTPQSSEDFVRELQRHGVELSSPEEIADIEMRREEAKEIRKVRPPKKIRRLVRIIMAFNLAVAIFIYLWFSPNFPYIGRSETPSEAGTGTSAAAAEDLSETGTIAVGAAESAAPTDRWVSDTAFVFLVKTSDLPEGIAEGAFTTDFIRDFAAPAAIEAMIPEEYPGRADTAELEDTFARHIMALGRVQVAEPQSSYHEEGATAFIISGNMLKDVLELSIEEWYAEE